MLAFTAQLSNTTDTTVAWSVNNIPGGSAQVGTISTDGTYTAPTDLPANGSVRVTATNGPFAFLIGNKNRADTSASRCSNLYHPTDGLTLPAWNVK